MLLHNNAISNITQKVNEEHETTKGYEFETDYISPSSGAEDDCFSSNRSPNSYLQEFAELELVQFNNPKENSPIEINHIINESSFHIEQ